MRIEIENWYKQSLYDLNRAKNAFKTEDYSLVVFSCQQAVEKSLKALLMKKNKVKWLPSHSLIYLGRECNVPKEFYTFFRELAPHYTLSRYPDAAIGIPAELYDREIAQRYLRKTEEFMKWIEKQIK